MRFAASSLTATFIMAAGHAIALGTPMAIIAPASLNGLAGMVYGSIKGTKLMTVLWVGHEADSLSPRRGQQL
jgi:hypothetical protein